MNKFSEASFSDYIEPKQGKYLVALKTESLRLVMSQNLKLLGCRISNEVLRVNPVGDKGEISLIRPSTLLDKTGLSLIGQNSESCWFSSITSASQCQLFITFLIIFEQTQGTR